MLYSSLIGARVLSEQNFVDPKKALSKLLIILLAPIA
ncbi:MAG: hypothetical protein ACI9CE_002512 [Flavobacterium sp.]